MVEPETSVDSYVLGVEKGIQNCPCDQKEVLRIPVDQLKLDNFSAREITSVIQQ